MISQQGLQQFKRLYWEKYSIQLTEQEAFELFSGLITTVKLGLATKPMQKIDSKLPGVTIKATYG